MIRLTLFLILGLGGAMAFFGQDGAPPQVEEISEAVLDDETGQIDDTAAAIEAALVDKLVDALAPVATPPTARVEATKTETLDLTEVKPTNSMLVLEASDAPPDAAVPVVPVVLPDNMKLLQVTGSSVNLRAGPSTNRPIVGRLSRGDRAELVSEAADGWMQVRDVASGKIGYMAGRFLAPADPG